MAFVPPARHLLRAEDLADARFFESLGVEALAAAAGLSRAARLGSTCQAMGVTGLEPVTSTLSSRKPKGPKRTAKRSGKPKAEDTGSDQNRPK